MIWVGEGPIFCSKIFSKIHCAWRYALSGERKLNLLVVGPIRGMGPVPPGKIERVQFGASVTVIFYIINTIVLVF